MVKSIKFLIPFFICLAACSQKQSDVRSVSSATNLPDQVMTKCDVAFSDSNFTKATLQADSGFGYSQLKRTVLLHNIKVNFYQKGKDSPISTLTADSVIVFDDTKNMTAIGNVRVVSTDNATNLTTKQLNWDNKTRKIYSSDYVKIISPQETLEGSGFESDERLSYYKILNAKGHN